MVRETKTTAKTMMKKIQLQNFMTFGNEVIHFKEGYTVIVGMNGSGKSSIFHAIQFVLGSTEKHDRYSRWSDFITWGKHKASVELTLSTPQGEDIVLSRSITRKGASTYKINGKRMNQREIHKLCQKLGINVNNPFVMVAQGNITKFSSLKPSDLLQTFELATGLDQVRAQILSTQEQVNEFNQDLERVEEEILRKTSDLDGLEQMHQRFIEKKKLIERLKEIEHLMTFARLQELSRRKKDLRSMLPLLKSKLENLEHELMNLKTHHEELTQKLQDLSKTVENVTMNLASKKARLETIKSSLAISKSRMLEIKKLIRNLRTKKVKIQKQIKLLDEDGEKIRNDLLSLQNRMTALLSQKEHLQQELETITKEIKSMDEEARNLQKQLSKFDQLQKNMERELGKVEGKIEQLLQLHQLFLHEKEKIEKNIQELHEQYQEHELLEVITHQEISSRFQTLQQERIEILRQLENLKKELQKLINYRERRDTLYPPAISALKKKIEEEQRDINGPLLDLLDIPPEITDAVVAVTSSERLYGFIAHSDEDVRWLINERRMLKARCSIFRPKKLSFLSRSMKPTNTITNGTKKDSTKKKNDNRIRGMLTELVKAEEPARGIIEELWGSIAVVEDIKTAQTLAQERAGQFVTLDGERIFSRQKMYEVPTKKREKSIHLPMSPKKLESLINELQSEIKEKEEILQGLENEISEHRKLLRYLQEKKSLEQELQSIINELQEKEQHIVTEKEHARALREKLKQVESERQVLERKLPQLRRQLTRSQEVQRLLEKTRNDLDDLFRLQESYQNRLHAIERKKISLIERKNSVDEDIKRRQEELQTLEADADLRVLEQLQDDVNALHDERETLLTQQKQWNEELIKTRSRMSVQEVAINQLRKQITQIEQRISQIEKEMEVLTTQIPDDFHVPSKIPPHHDLEVERDVLTLKLDEYRDVPEDLESQKQKLIEELQEIRKEKETVQKNIKELENLIPTLKKQYREEITRNIGKLQEYMNEILNVIDSKCSFIIKGEGIDLELEMEVSFRSQTSNRRIQSLSGGEQTVVAMAFILALQRFNPSPFYVYDEFDIHLDPHNTALLAKLIKEASKRSQFIILTPAKSVELIEPADHIIGIARAPKSLSLVIELPLNELMTTIEAST